MSVEAPAGTPRTAIDLLVRFHIVLKIAKFYEPNNANLRGQLKLLHLSLLQAFQAEDEVALRLSQNSLFFNRVRVRFDFSNYYVYKAVVEEFNLLELGSVTFRAGLPPEELAGFMIFLARADVRGGISPFDELRRQLEAHGFPHLAIGRLEPGEQEADRDRRAAKMYFLGIYHLKDIFERQREALNFNVTKRWIQSVFNIIAGDESFMYGLTNIKNFDEYTLNHSVNVSVLSVALGRRLGLDRRELIELGVSAFLHDLGKLDIPREILEKPTRLDAVERAVIEKHSHLGAERLIQMRAARGVPVRAVQVVLEHHVKADMTGYPRYFRKSTINLFSKIVKIADYFDALTTPRVYRPKAFTREEALRLMREKSGEEFDPLLLKAFISMIGAHPIGSLVALDTGEFGIVFEANPHMSFALRPKVKLITDAAGRKTDGPVVDLADVDPDSRRFRRTIVRTLDPDRYGVKVADYFLNRVV